MKTITLIISAIILFSQASYSQTATDFTKTDVDGNTYTLFEELAKGKAVVIDFFATWCTSCQAYVPALEQMHQDYGEGSNAWIWAIDTYDNETEQQIKDYKTSLGATYTAFAEGSSIANDYGTVGIPHFLVICPDSTIAYDNSGWSTDTDTDIRNAINSCNVWALGINKNNPNESLPSLTVYPNPAFDNSTITFFLKERSNIRIELFNLLGQKEFTILDGTRSFGIHQVQIDVKGLTPGMYIIDFSTDKGIANSIKFYIN
ncbi:MAG: redoxin domain-containing protein [Bacteroidia bacterium]|nr:redoxin domain-containing protein [Bacteroidia bacterium]